MKYDEELKILGMILYLQLRGIITITQQAEFIIKLKEMKQEE